MRWFPLLVLLATSCATTPRGPGDRPAPPPSSDPGEWVSWPLAPPPPPPHSGARERLVTRAASLVGLSSVRLATPHLPDDCTGLARAVYEDAGVELMGAGMAGDNGVTAIYRLALEHSALHRDRPAPGDLVFFEETYDRNRNGRVDDGLTHVGVVETVAEDGTVTFVHRGGSGVSRSRLNLEAPLDRARNDWLRPARRGVAGRLTGELFVAYASASRLLEALARR